MKRNLSIAAIATLVMIAACKKEASLPDRFTPIPASNTNVKFLNLSPGAASVNFIVNGAKISATNPSGTGALVVTGMAYPSAYPNIFGYTTFASGNQKIDVKVPDSAAVNPGATLLSTNQTFAAGKFYSVAMVDTVIQPKVVVVEDDPSIPDPTKSYLRIANFIADSAVNVTVTKTNTGYAYTKTYPSIAPQTVLAFDSLGAGQTFSIVFRRVSNNATIATLTGFAPLASKKYTILGAGMLRSFTSLRFGTYSNF